MKNYVKLLLALISILCAPMLAYAQETIPVYIEITGELAYEDVDGDNISEVLIDEVVILPPFGFDALEYPAGQQITVVGSLLPDNTIQAISFVPAELADDAQQTPEFEPTTAPDDAEDAEDEEERRQEELEREEEKRQEELEREEEKRQEELEREEEKRQEERERENEQQREEVEITGEITSVTQNTIIVNGESIEGGGMFQPGQMEVGQFVRVVGVRENNGRIKPNEFEILIGEETEIEATAAAADNVPPCVTEDHPIVEILTEEFGASASDLIAFHCRDSFGFADIARAYLLNEITAQPAQTFLDAFTQGADWGQIARNAGLDPAALASGRVLEGD